MYISLLYRKITRLDPSPPFANAVEQVAMVNKTLSEIISEKEFDHQGKSS
jgi:hypothetical protein